MNARYCGQSMRYVMDKCDVLSNFDYYSQTDSSGMRGIYPSFLTLKREQMSDVEVSFLDVLIYRAGDVFSTKIFDKREHPPLSFINNLKYPHPSCFLSGRSKLGIITSRLWCFGRICKRDVFRKCVVGISQCCFINRNQLSQTK